EVDVVVDRLGDADDGDVQAAALDLGDNAHRTADRSVSAHDEQHVDTPLDEIVHHALWRLFTSGRAKKGAACVMNACDGLCREVVGIDADTVNQAFIAVAKAEHTFHAVAVGQFQDDAADHVVETRAEAAARHDAACDLARFEEDLVSWPR